MAEREWPIVNAVRRAVADTFGVDRADVAGILWVKCAEEGGLEIAYRDGRDQTVYDYIHENEIDHFINDVAERAFAEGRASVAHRPAGLG